MGYFHLIRSSLNISLDLQSAINRQWKSVEFYFSNLKVEAAEEF